jgi:hypothetical protein
MTISDPVPIYRAATNMQAHLLCGHLEQNGIDAHVVEDNSINGGWLFGLLPQVHKPEVCVDRRNREQARLLIEAFERSERERQARQNSVPIETEFVAVVCEECGAKTPFPASQLGTLQECPRCSAYVDVGEPEDPESEVA